MHVLIADDDLVAGNLLKRTLERWEYEVQWVRDGDAAWEVMQRPDAPRLAILDWMMPGLEGPEICRRVRERSCEEYIYIILLTSMGAKDQLVEGIESGADDYIIKPFNPHELQVRLRGGRRIVDLQTQLIAAREEMRQQAPHDMLTGVWNRAAIFDILSRAANRVYREQGALSVVMADLDHFKQVNDTYGHQAGDVVLREAVNRVAGVLRPYDSLGRYGGEEFMAVLPGCQGDEARMVAERVREAIAAHPIVAGDERLAVTVSLGLSCCAAPAEPVDIDALVKDADEALYAAKGAGRNRVVMAGDPGLSVPIQRAMQDAPQEVSVS